jgi:hypothetical protein
MTPRRALWGLIVVSAVLRLGWAAALGLGNDEAYHYLFTVHPAWGYFDHPPMLAWVEAAGLAAAGGRISPLSLRLGFVGLFAGSTWLLFRLTDRLYGPCAGVLAAFGLNVTAYHSAAGAFALPDGPLLFFWLLTLDRLSAALLAAPAGPGRPGTWLGVGLAWGGALLSKYHAVFLPLGALVYLAATPSARGWLRRPGPYLAAAVGLTLFAPVVAWNATHGWASFAFQGGRALGGGGFRPGTLAAALIGPAVYLFPWIWARLVGLLVGRGRRFFDPETPAADRFLLAQAVGPLATFLVVACTRPVLPHWTLVGFLPLYPMLGRAWEGLMRADPSRFRRRAAVLAAVPVLAASLTLVHARTGFFQKGRSGGIGLVAAKGDPTADMVGWDLLARELGRRGLLGRPGTFLFSPSWYYSGQLGFATRGSGTPVLCYHAWDARSFAFWSRPDEWVGRDGIFVAVNEHPEDAVRFDKWFTRIEPLGSFEVTRGGVPVRTVALYRCTPQTVAFPFDDLGRTIRSRRGTDRPERRVADRSAAAAAAPPR